MERTACGALRSSYNPWARGLHQWVRAAVAASRPSKNPWARVKLDIDKETLVIEPSSPSLKSVALPLRINPVMERSG
ncbi:hypothetical protein NDU88_004517 [Pleurodeles waltl]|uniref:Uncharacterized protein n=1 Tax=Pleurodeles waltl TaxID=8319 RepID=A0AAV7T9U3_PLEWA|nr:hypothetical protein NDU88_004517 [Pleurodeles waltl]